MSKFSKINLAISTALLTAPGTSLAADIRFDVVNPNGTMDIKNVLLSITTWVLGLVGLIAVLYLIYGGLQYITSAGNADKAKLAKSTILYAVIGLIVIALSYVIIAFISDNLSKVVTG